jgi:hypothetical protein
MQWDMKQKSDGMDYGNNTILVPFSPKYPIHSLINID